MSRALLRSALHRWPFEAGAELYAWVTGNALWDASCRQLAAHFPTPLPGRPLTVLDLGCGPARTTRALARSLSGQQKVIGVDLSWRMLQLARRERGGGLPLVRADAGALPFAGDSVDVVTGHSFLYLVADRPRVLREAFRVLRPGGRYVSMEPGEGPKDVRFLRRAATDLRFAVSLALWRPFSRLHGQLGETPFRTLLGGAGFEDLLVSPALGGFGTIGRGQKPGRPDVTALRGR